MTGLPLRSATLRSYLIIIRKKAVIWRDVRRICDLSWQNSQHVAGRSQELAEGGTKSQDWVSWTVSYPTFVELRVTTMKKQAATFMHFPLSEAQC